MYKNWLWNFRIFGSLSEQSAQLRAVLDIMKFKNMDLLTLNESPCPGNGLSSVRDSAILRSGFPSSHKDLIHPHLAQSAF